MRVLKDLHHLRSIGAAQPFVREAKGGDCIPKGVIRPALSAEDILARHWLMERCTEAGLEARMDRIGTTAALSPGALEDGPPRILLGSHSDTQPTGGWLDGALGVVYALETARALAEVGAAGLVDIINFQDEEGRFGALVGSRSFCGIEPSWDTVSSCPEEVCPKITLENAVRQRGLANLPLFNIHDTNQPFATRRYCGFFEAHIEQGKRLERAARSVAVVSSIVGMRTLRVTFQGEQNHAGTCTMWDRKDAAAACFTWAHMISEAFAELRERHKGGGGARTNGEGQDSVWTIGKFALTPNAPSIIPGWTQCTLQFRDVSEPYLDQMEELAFQVATQVQTSSGVSISIVEDRVPITATNMDPDMMECIEQVADDECKGKWQTLHSGAIHDALTMASKMPSSMLFVPSINGVSHDFTEDTHEQDIVMGAQVYARAAALMLQRAQAVAVLAAWERV